MKKVFPAMGMLLLLTCTNVIAETIIFSDDFEAGEFNSSFWTAIPDIPDGIVDVISSVNSVEVARLGLYGGCGVG